MGKDRGGGQNGALEDILRLHRVRFGGRSFSQEQERQQTEAEVWTDGQKRRQAGLKAEQEQERKGGNRRRQVEARAGEEGWQ